MKVHVFPFSPREGTPAFGYPDQVSAAVKETRCARLQKAADAIREDFMRSLIGQTAEVLFETAKNGVQHGYTRNYTPVCVRTDEPLTGGIRNVRISGTANGECIGSLSR